MGAGCAEFTAGGGESGDLDHRFGVLRGQLEADLPSSGKLDVDLREQLGIEQRAVANAMTA